MAEVILEGYNKNLLMIRDEIVDALKSTTLAHMTAMMDALQEEAPEWEGVLKRSFRGELKITKENGTLVYGFDIVSDVIQSVVMEFGRKPGPTPLTEKLRRWSESKGLDPKRVVAKITKRGIAPRRYVEKAWEKVLRIGGAEQEAETNREDKEAQMFQKVLGKTVKDIMHYFTFKVTLK